MSETRNCKEYCRFARCCYTKGIIGQDPLECPNAWKIEDILNDYTPEDDPEEYEEEDDEE